MAEVGIQLTKNKQQQEQVLLEAGRARAELLVLLGTDTSENLAEFDEGAAARLVQTIQKCKYQIRNLRREYEQLAALA